MPDMYLMVELLFEVLRIAAILPMTRPPLPSFAPVQHGKTRVCDVRFVLEAGEPRDMEEFKREMIDPKSYFEPFKMVDAFLALK
jgi:hypothetical protein